MKPENKKQEDTSKHESKSFTKEGMFIGTILILVLIFASIFLYRYLNTPEVLTPTQMHVKNIAGELDEEQGYVWNGYSFVFYEGLWFTQVYRKNTENIYNVQLHFGPKEIEEIPIVGDADIFATFPNLYFTFDPIGRELNYVALAAGELSLNTAVVMNVTPVAACTKNETDICKTRPIVSCGKNTKNPIIFIDPMHEPGIYAEGNCLTLGGSGEDLIKSTDKLLLRWFAVI